MLGLFTSTILIIFLAAISIAQTTRPAPAGSVVKVRSSDGTGIAVECMGSGPSMLIVHGGSGDRKRWRPLLSLFASRFYACAMDRRGHGESIDTTKYQLKKEFEDVEAVVNSLPGPVFVLGHSYGGVCSLETARRTDKIAKLVLYEPPLQDLDHTAVADSMEKLIAAGDREKALTTFLTEIVRLTGPEIDTMRSRPTWKDRVSGVDIQIREIRALSRYRFEAAKFKRLGIPTLLLQGSRTASPQLKLAIETLRNTLPNRTLHVFEGHEHNAMDAIPQEFADVVTRFFLITNSKTE